MIKTTEEKMKENVGKVIKYCHTVDRQELLVLGKLIYREITQEYFYNVQAVLVTKEGTILTDNHAMDAQEVLDLLASGICKVVSQIE